jgi:hypothetical protein
VVNLWDAAPSYTNGDGGIYVAITGSAGWLGQFSFSMNQFGDGASGRAGLSYGPAIVLDPSITTIYWDLLTQSGVTPISDQQFNLTAECHG